MMTRTLLARCAPLAIAASAALPAIPAASQDAVTAEPVIVLPEPAPAPAAAPAPVAAPAIVLPQVTARAPEAVATAEPVAAPAAGPAPRTAPTERRAAAPAAAPVTTRAMPVAAASPVASAPAAAPAITPAKAAPAQANRSTPASDATGELALAGLLGALGLAAVGGIAYAASRRRRRVIDNGYDGEVVAYEPVFDEPAVNPAPVQAPVFTAPAAMASALTAPLVASAPSARSTTRQGNGDPIALPQEMPETFEERDALLRELVAARPDKANPFTSPRARARRAKLIIQSLGRDFTSRKPRFDLSEYTNRWPALRGWQPATA